MLLLYFCILLTVTLLIYSLPVNICCLFHFMLFSAYYDFTVDKINPK